MDTHYWHQAADKLAIRNKALIDGQLVGSASGETFATINPATGKVLAQVAAGDAEDIDKAVKAAKRAFELGVWAHRPPAERKKVLQRLAELTLAHAEELALLDTLDMGKPISDARNIDVPLCATNLSWMGEAIDKIYDEVAPTSRDVLAIIRRDPLGVVGAVVPWNYPLLMAMWKIAPALAAGNSIVVKPAEQSPLSVIRFAELALEAGLPAGVLNVVPGFGETAGKALGLHMDVDALAFTGSTEVGKLFLQYSGQSNMKRVSLECGGKSPHIVMADCASLDVAAASVASGIFFNQGEVCNAGSRLLVDQAIKDEFLEKLLKASEIYTPADPLLADTKMGAMVSKEQMDRVLDYVSIGQAEGANLVLGGRQVHADTGGCFIEPTIFDGVVNSNRIAQEEIFGPVLAVIEFDGDEVVKVANDTIYGLAAGVWTSNINTALSLSRDLRAGTVFVNCFDEGNITTPFGGFKQSGFGRDKSLHAIDKYSDLKTTWISIG